MVLEELYRATLAACDPERLVAQLDRRDLPRVVAGIGKCAGAMLDGFGDFDEAFVVIPSGYRLPRSPRARVFAGGHPDMNEASFAAGRALLDFVDAHDDLTFLVSGGGSACVEVPLPPHDERELIDTNARLVASGQPIGEINRVRRSLSAIKGGRLGARVRGRCATLVYSDVSTGRLEDVASGPVLRNLHLVADNTTLVHTAARLARERGLQPVVLEEQVEGDVADAARFLAERLSRLQPGQTLVAGGEPTVVVRGGGKGGRCSELAVRFALACRDRVDALFAGSDGVDGNSGAAGVVISLPAPLDRAGAERELLQSNSFVAAEGLGRAIMIAPAGNNLRDLYLLARG